MTVTVTQVFLSFDGFSVFRSTSQVLGVPGWLNWSSVRILVLVQVHDLVVLGSSPTVGSHLGGEACLKIVSLCPPPAPLPPCTHPLFPSNKSFLFFKEY